MSNETEDTESELAGQFKTVQENVLFPKYWKNYENNKLPLAVSLMADVMKHVCSCGKKHTSGATLPDRDKLYTDLDRIAKLLGFKGVTK